MKPEQEQHHLVETLRRAAFYSPSAEKVLLQRKARSAAPGQTGPFRTPGAPPPPAPSAGPAASLPPRPARGGEQPGATP